MSQHHQVCQYYIQGRCKYDHRCRFLHEDAYGSSYTQSRSSQQNYHRNENYSRNYSQNHSSSHVHGHNNSYNHHNNYEKDYSQTHSRHHAQNHNVTHRSNYTNNSYSSKENYHRYHVDNRQKQVESRNSDSISLIEFLDLVNFELTNHQQSRMWPFTVIAPVKDFGNIPEGFEDWSPEEVRYEYYESMAKNTLYDFDKKMKDTLNKVTEYRQLFLLKSSSALDILKRMMQEPKSASTNSDTTAASTFSFDLSKLNANQSPMSEDMNTQSGANFSFNSLQNANPVQANMSSVFSGNQTSAFGFPNVPSHAGDSQINTFSFNINHLRSTPENPVEPRDIHNAFGNTSNVNDAIYSVLEELPTECVEQFRTKTFKAGKIPFFPPPKELCIS